jgi:hypothetical protein
MEEFLLYRAEQEEHLALLCPIYKDKINLGHNQDSFQNLVDKDISDA